LAVLDVDVRDGGDVTLAQLEADHSPLPSTPTVVTGSGGFHHYLWAPLYLRSRNLRSLELDGLEIKAAGTQVVAPPSVHPDTGKEYCWHPAHPLVGEEIASLPDWLAALTPAPRPRGQQGNSGDPLRQLPATVYVPVLLGREVDSAGNVLCPFHTEVEPSLHVYDGDRGWFCFGCGRGGSIIDLGAALYGITPRADGYRAIRQRVASRLLEAR
jgi:hypothetical protein